MGKLLGIAAAAAAVIGFGSAAQAAYTQLDLSAYVNEGFNNGGWYINGTDFLPIVGSTFGNQGSSVPFTVASAPDVNGNQNNFWFGLNTPGDPTSLFGPQGSFTIPVLTPNAKSVFVLADNTFGYPGSAEFLVTFNGTAGSITRVYIGALNTKDYNVNCGTTGCDFTPNAKYWYIDPEGGQWLQQTGWTLPSGFGLQSITFNQVDGFDGAIVAGVTLSSAPAPEPASWALMILGVGAIGLAARRSRRLAVG
jgi:hypothetical protein